jgi:hypothetical protein
MKPDQRNNDFGRILNWFHIGYRVFCMIFLGIPFYFHERNVWMGLFGAAIGFSMSYVFMRSRWEIRRSERKRNAEPPEER